MEGHLTSWKPLPALTSLPIAISLGASLGRGKLALVSCSNITYRYDIVTHSASVVVYIIDYIAAAN